MYPNVARNSVTKRSLRRFSVEKCKHLAPCQIADAKCKWPAPISSPNYAIYHQLIARKNDFLFSYFFNKQIADLQRPCHHETLRRRQETRLREARGLFFFLLGGRRSSSAGFLDLGLLGLLLLLFCLPMNSCKFQTLFTLMCLPNNNFTKIQT